MPATQKLMSVYTGSASSTPIDIRGLEEENLLFFFAGSFGGNNIVVEIEPEYLSAVWIAVGSAQTANGMQRIQARGARLRVTPSAGVTVMNVWMLHGR